MFSLCFNCIVFQTLLLSQLDCSISLMSQIDYFSIAESCWQSVCKSFMSPYKSSKSTYYPLTAVSSKSSGAFWETQQWKVPRVPRLFLETYHCKVPTVLQFLQEPITVKFQKFFGFLQKPIIVKFQKFPEGASRTLSCWGCSQCACAS